MSQGTFGSSYNVVSGPGRLPGEYLSDPFIMPNHDPHGMSRNFDQAHVPGHPYGQAPIDSAAVGGVGRWEESDMTDEESDPFYKGGAMMEAEDEHGRDVKTPALEGYAMHNGGGARFGQAKGGYGYGQPGTFEVNRPGAPPAYRHAYV